MNALSIDTGRAAASGTQAGAAKRRRRARGWLAPSPPTVAIEIASRRVTVVELAHAGGSIVVAAHASEPLPATAVTPALGGPNIPDPRPVADALRRAMQRAGIGSIRRAALIVPDGIARVSLLRFDQPPVRAIELDQLIKWQLRKATPFALDEAQVAHFLANTQEGGATFAAVVARRDVIAQYEAVTAAAGVHAGIVDLASFNVMNAVVAAGTPAGGDATTGSGALRGLAGGDCLLICMTHEGTTIAILRGAELMFYRHRASIDEEPLSALVHQTAMYHEDRLGGSAFSRVWLCGAALANVAANRVRWEVSDRVGVPAETVDVRPAAGLRDRVAAGPEVLDALAAPVGVLLREWTA